MRAAAAAGDTVPLNHKIIVDHIGGATRFFSIRLKSHRLIRGERIVSKNPKH
jgi:hypothetical protein